MTGQGTAGSGCRTASGPLAERSCGPARPRDNWRAALHSRCDRRRRLGPEPVTLRRLLPAWLLALVLVIVAVLSPVDAPAATPSIPDERWGLSRRRRAGPWWACPFAGRS